MSPEEQQRHEADAAAAARAREKRDERIADRNFAKLTPEQQQEEMLKRLVDAAVDARIKQLVLQAGPGMSITGGNGNWTFQLDPDALSMTGNGVCNADGTSTFTFKLST